MHLQLLQRCGGHFERDSLQELIIRKRPSNDYFLKVVYLFITVQNNNTHTRAYLVYVVEGDK